MKFKNIVIGVLTVGCIITGSAKEASAYEKVYSGTFSNLVYSSTYFNTSKDKATSIKGGLQSSSKGINTKAKYNLINKSNEGDVVHTSFTKTGSYGSGNPFTGSFKAFGGSTVYLRMDNLNEKPTIGSRPSITASGTIVY